MSKRKQRVEGVRAAAEAPPEFHSNGVVRAKRPPPFVPESYADWYRRRKQ